MNKFLLVAVIAAFTVTQHTYAQAPVLGTVAGYSLFSKNGSVTNTGLSQLTGNVGTNNGAGTNFGNVDGLMLDGGVATAIAAVELTTAYNQLQAATPTFFPSPLLGNGQILNAGVYAIGESASLNNALTLDAQGNANAVFIFQIGGAFSSAANAQIILANGAQACNVYWKVEGLAHFAANTSFKGTLVVNNAAIVLDSGVIIEGRALTTTGAITVSNVTVRIPVGCAGAELTGPPEPVLASVACYTIFSGSGEVTNAGITFVTGDIGTNVGLVTGYQAANVTGTIHPNPDVSTAQCAADLNTVYAYLSTLPTDIPLLYPPQFGNGLELTPHTYLLSGATVLTGILTLNAQDNEDAVFVIKIDGALSTSTYASVVLKNGAKAENVFWKVDGAISLNDYADFKGTLIGNNGAMILNTAVTLEGRALSTSGGVSTFGINAMMTPGCPNLAIAPVVAKNNAVLFPNPFSSQLNVAFAGAGVREIAIYNAMGILMLKRNLTEKDSNIQTSLSDGIYFYQITGDDGTVQTGKLVSKH